MVKSRNRSRSRSRNGKRNNYSGGRIDPVGFNINNIWSQAAPINLNMNSVRKQSGGDKYFDQFSNPPIPQGFFESKGGKRRTRKLRGGQSTEKTGETVIVTDPLGSNNGQPATITVIDEVLGKQSGNSSAPSPPVVSSSLPPAPSVVYPTSQANTASQASPVSASTQVSAISQASPLQYAQYSQIGNYPAPQPPTTNLNNPLGPLSGGLRRRQNKSHSRSRRQRGGQETAGATYLPPQFFDPKIPLVKGKNPNGIETAYGPINAVSGSCRNLAPFPNSSMELTGGRKRSKSRNSSRRQRGGQETAGATYLPPQFFDPKIPLVKGKNPNGIETAYGPINAVSGSCRNLAPFPNSSMELTGGKKKSKAKSRSKSRPKKTKARSKSRPKKTKARSKSRSKSRPKKTKKGKSLLNRIKKLF